MTYQEEMYAHLVHGGDPQVLIDEFMKELEEAKKQAEKQLAREKEAEAAAKQFEEKRKIAREKAVTALKEYLPLVVKNVKEEDADNAVTAVVKGLEITKGAQKYSDWDVIDLMALVNTIFE